ncbi:caspase family protein [Bradyrhizobium sp. LeoA1S1]
MRKALIVGIDHYAHINSLRGAVNDAYEVKAMLDRHADSSVNFGSRIIVGTGPNDIVTRVELKDAVKELFADDTEISLFYFAGHGYIEPTGGYLCAGDCKTGDDGLPLSDIMSFALNSPARNKIIILDSCHSGAFGQSHLNNQVSEIGEGMTILTASTKNQYAMEKNGGGLFTGLLVDALGGAAANLVGEITPGSVYAHIDQSLGSWSQRPVFKTNVKTFVSLRKIQPPLPPSDLRRINEFFPAPGHEFQLDPSYEPEHPSADPAKTPIFAILQKYNRVNLAVPVGTTHPYHAAIESKTMKLTALGEHYRRLVEEGLL